jgi:nucleoside-diphosphate-sugar epimerase
MKKNNIKKVLLTGGTGFVGSSLLRRLISNSYEVILVKHSFSNIFRIKNELERVKVYDLDRVSLREIFEENEISTIIHCATKYDTNEDTSDILEANLMFPVKLLEQAVKSGKDIVFINTDSFFNKEDIGGVYVSSKILSVQKTTSIVVEIFLSSCKNFEHSIRACLWSL